MGSLKDLSVTEFEKDISQRVVNICDAMGIEPDAKSPKLHTYTVELPDMSIWDVFEDTNAALGSTWLWSYNKFYFSREADAVWFRMRWS